MIVHALALRTDCANERLDRDVHRVLGLTGVYGEIKRRPETRDGLQTWMEIYVGTGDGFDAALSAAVSDAALSELIEGDRRVEVFMDLSPCA